MDTHGPKGLGRRIFETIENGMFALLGGLVGHAWQKGTEKVGEKVGDQVGAAISASLAVNEKKLVSLWRPLATADRIAYQRLVDRMDRRNRCEPPYRSGDENIAAEVLSGFYEETAEEDRLELGKWLGHMTDPQFDTLIAVGHNNNGIQLIQRLLGTAHETLVQADNTLAPAINDLTRRLRENRERREREHPWRRMILGF